MTAAQLRRKRRRGRANASAFAALIAAPAAGAFDMPANGSIRFVGSGAVTQGNPIAALEGAVSRTIGSPGWAGAGEHLKLDFVERGVQVIPVAGVDVDVDIGLGVWKRISNG